MHHLLCPRTCTTRKEVMATPANTLNDMVDNHVVRHGARALGLLVAAVSFTTLTLVAISAIVDGLSS